MRQKTKKNASRKLKVLGVATLFAFTFSLPIVKAQESINAAGKNASGSGGSVSYSVGQTTYHTQIGTNASAADGVQHPYEIWVVTSIGDAMGINHNISVFPNPTKYFLTLEVSDFDLTGLTYQLFDMSGKILREELIIDTHTLIDLNQIVPAVYFVRVILAKKEIKTFKVIKN